MRSLLPIVWIFEDLGSDDVLYVVDFVVMTINHMRKPTSTTRSGFVWCLQPSTAPPAVRPPVRFRAEFTSLFHAP